MTEQVKLEEYSVAQLNNICGNHDENFKMIEDALKVEISLRGDELSLTGKDSESFEEAKKVIFALLKLVSKGINISRRDVIYALKLVKEDKLKDCVYGIKGLDIKGCNVTIPHKVNIIKYLDSIDDNAKLIGAVNTIKNKGGILKGYNTDGRGFVKSILDKDYDIKNKKVMIIGAGGACRSIAIEMASQGVRSIEIRNRIS